MSAFCPTCLAPLVPGRILCDKCGGYCWNAPTDKGFTRPTIKATELVDAADVDASHIEHIVTGLPCDPVWGGGPVPGSTTLFAGLAGGGKTTLLLQIAHILARISGRPGYYISGEQAKDELRFTLDRLQIDLKHGELILAKTMDSSGLIDDGVLIERPPSSIIVDSLTEICGQKDYDLQAALAKAYKAVAVKWRCPVFMISQMNKEGNTTGLNALQHGPDTLVEFQVLDDGRRRARILREYGLEDGDVRMLMAYKNRFGATHVEYPLLMTEHGLTAIPKSMERTRARTGNEVVDLVSEIEWKDDEIERAKQDIREMREERADLEDRLAKAVTKAAKEAARMQKAQKRAAKPPKDPPKAPKGPEKKGKKKAA